MFSASAFAGLGESESSVMRDAEKLGAAAPRPVEHTQNSGPLYTVHTLSKNGLTLREFVDTSGNIFALAWNGNAHPDLSQLLGTYLSDYKVALQNSAPTPGQRRFGVLQGQKVTVERSGLMGKSRGRAYVRSLIPAGVSLDEIQ